MAEDRRVDGGVHGTHKLFELFGPLGCSSLLRFALQVNQHVAHVLACFNALSPGDVLAVQALQLRQGGNDEILGMGPFHAGVTHQEKLLEVSQGHQMLNTVLEMIQVNEIHSQVQLFEELARPVQASHHVWYVW